VVHEQEFLIEMLCRLVRNRDAAKVRSKTKRLRDPEGTRAYARAHYKANPEAAKERSKTWKKSNPKKARAAEKKWRDDHPESVRESRTKWQVNNPEKIREVKRRRRAREFGSDEHFTSEQWLKLKSFYGNRCLCCGREEIQLLRSGLMLVPDHVVALASGGSNNISNIQPLCQGPRGCNNIKSSRTKDYR